MGAASQNRTPDTQFFRDVFNASPIGIAVENLEGQPLFVNPAFCSMLGFSEEELRCKHCVDFSPPEDAQKDWALFQQLKAGSIDHYQLEKRYFRKDGSLVWGRLSISLLKSHPSPLVVAMVEDITDKKKAEEARFRDAAVIESSDDAIASGTLDGIIVSWNAGAQKMYGYTEAEAVGKPINMLVPPEIPDEENKILEMLRAGGSIQHFETVRVTKMGKRIDVSLTISPIKDSSGRTVGCSGIARDISERKLAEAALGASEERLRLAQQAARIGSFESNVQTGVNTWTPELEAMYGLQPGGFSQTQTAFENLVHADDRASVIKLCDRALKTGQPTEGEWRVVWADGSVHWIAGRWQVFMDASGEPSKMIGVNIDVTQRKRAEEALRESEDKLRLLLDSTAESIYGIDLEHRCTFCNPACLRTLGYEHVDEVMGKNTHDLIHHSRADGTVIPVEECPIHRVARSGEGVHAEDEMFWKANGTSFPVEYWSYPQRRGEEVVGAVVAFSDITERKLAEEKLREYEKAVEGSEEMMAVVDREYRYLIANCKFLSLRNMTKEQVVGRLVPEVLNKGVFETVVKEKLDECFRGRVVRYEMRYTYPELGERDLFISNFPIEGSGGVDRVACILQDITERKRAEEALSCMNRRVIEAEERERNRIAKDLHEDIGQRLALLAIAVEQLKTDLPHQAVELLDRVDAVWKQSLEILTDVKASAHELYSPRLEYLGIAAVMRSFCAEFGQRKKVKIDFRNDSVPSLVQPEVGICLFRVLQEALHNGVKHSGVKKFEVRLWGASDGIHLTVRDSGAGFDTDTARKGRGLGLTRIEQRVRLVNGTFSVDSQPEKGTTVHVSVPLNSGSDSIRATG